MSIVQKTHNQVRGIWIWGEPGIGKTWKARHDYGEFPFMKPQNKWWDTYEGERVVILDDLDKCGGQALGHYLKIWADKYPFKAEVKGDTIKPEYDHFIVTSNYTIDDLYEDEQLRMAIKRRFKVIHMSEPFKPKAKPAAQPEDLPALFEAELRDHSDQREVKECLDAVLEQI